MGAIFMSKSMCQCVRGGRSKFNNITAHLQHYNFYISYYLSCKYYISQNQACANFAKRANVRYL